MADWHRHTGQHPLGGGRPSFARMDSVGGGSSRDFPGSIFCGGGSSRNFQGSIFCGVPEFFPLSPVTDTKFVFFFPLTPVTDPKFFLFKHVLCFARIMSNLCPNSCRQTARIGGQLPPPVPYAYAGWCTYPPLCEVIDSLLIPIFRWLLKYHMLQPLFICLELLRYEILSPLWMQKFDPWTGNITT